MNRSCPIWGTPASSRSIGAGSDVDSPRAGGMYFIRIPVGNLLRSPDDDRIKARLTSIFIEQRRLGNRYPEISAEEIGHARNSRDKSIHRRADSLLQFIQSRTPDIGTKIHYRSIPNETEHEVKNMPINDIPKEILIHWNMLAHSESLSSTEVQFLLDYLVDKLWISRGKGSNFHGFNYNLTVQGYERLAEIDYTTKDSSQAFVAMWFDKSMNEVWGNGFRSAIEDAGYKPVRIDKKEHVNKIDDEIIAEIKRSRFLVADFTQGTDGARGGVYYEAGFARGLDIPVIFTCRKDVLGKIHFDVRQYNTITWEKNKMSELRKNLKNRISAVIGDGPLRK